MPRQHSYGTFTPTNLTLISLALCIVSVFIGVWAAYDREVALMRVSFIAVGLAMVIGLALLARWRGLRALGWAALLCGLLALGLGLDYLLLGNLSSSMVATAQIILLPLTLAGAFWTAQRRSWLPMSLAVAGAMVGLVALLLAGERSAWLGLLGGMVGALVLYGRAIVLRKSRWRRVVDILLAAIGLMILAALWLAFRSPDAITPVTAVVGGLGTNRLDLWEASLALIGDYLFTGSGLGATPMVFSTYAFLYHVPFLYHAHNLYLQITLEQGILGLLAFLGLLAGSIWSLARALPSPDKSIRMLAVAVSVSLLAIAISGLADAEIYIGVLAPLVFLPAGFALALEQVAPQTERPDSIGQRETKHSWRTWASAGIILVVGIILVAALPGIQAQFQANLGAVDQTRSELSVYSWPAYGIQDELRRSPAVNLDPAIRHYQAAIVLDPGNVTAQRRLGQIFISQGDYEAAIEHLQNAYDAAPEQRTTRQLLGEAYAVTGRIDEAAALWQTVNADEEKFRERYWWYSNIDAEQEARWFGEAYRLARPAPNS